MPRRFTGIRLLLIFVGINLVMFLMLVTSMTSAHPWLAKILPGQFETGVNSSGYWVFFALVLLVDALTVFIAGLALMLPAMFEGAPVDERRLTRHLVDRGGVSDEAKEAIFVSLREDAVNAYYQLVVGRMILLAGAIFLILAFFATSYVFTRAVPDGAMFQTAVPVQLTDTANGTKITVVGYTPVKNTTVRADQIARFTADQVVAAVALNAPHIYGFRLVALSSNPKLPLFTHFLFAFRIFLIFTLLLTVLSLLRRPQRPPREKKTIESVEAKLEEVKAKA
jgi:hypothetical protein